MIAIETALARYKTGKCPGCGKGRGEPRGLEYRTRAQDIYCHSCKKPWPLEMDAVDMRLELLNQAAPQPNNDGRPGDKFPTGVNSEGLRRASRASRITGLIGMLGFRRHQRQRIEDKARSL